MSQPLIVTPKIKLKNFDPAYCDKKTKDDVATLTQKYTEKLGEQQELLYAGASKSVVILFQAMDCGGKDGAGKRVLQDVNPAGVETSNFKAPTSEEKAHDYLWRIHRALPRHGNIGIFNRSHYEDILVPTVLKLLPKKVIERRIDQINAFEDYLKENGVLLMKFFLHISKDEQKERLQARLDDPAKNWKFSTADLETRARWDDFQDAYELILNGCSTKGTPWHIIPANRKWYRDYVIAKTVVEAIDGLELKWPAPIADISKIKIV